MKYKPILDEDLAEVVGALIGDGCLCKFWSKTRGAWRHELLFTGNWDKDHEYYLTHIQPVIHEKFGVRGYLQHRKDDDTVRYSVWSKRVVNFFCELSLPLGPKGSSLAIPSEIIADNSLAKACLRGIFSTDGCVYRRYSKRYSNHARYYGDYAVVQFKMKSRKLIDDIKMILENLGIRTTRIGEDGSCWVCRVTAQKDVDIFMGKLSIAHPYHIERYNKIRRNA